MRKKLPLSYEDITEEEDDIDEPIVIRPNGGARGSNAGAKSSEGIQQVQNGNKRRGPSDIMTEPSPTPAPAGQASTACSTTLFSSSAPITLSLLVIYRIFLGKI